MIWLRLGPLQLDRSVVTDLRRLVDVILQTGEAAEARLYMQPRVERPARV